jgi:hypothetical protein
MPKLRALLGILPGNGAPDAISAGQAWRTARRMGKHGRAVANG